MDIRDQLPMPPCGHCGVGLCEKSELHTGYVCRNCGKNYAVMIYEGPDYEILVQLGPIMLHFNTTTSHWMKAMTEAFSRLDYLSAMNAIETYKKWLDEVATPMIDRIRQIKAGEALDPIPPGDLEIPGGWGT